jgi:hypothetical protein
VPPVQELDVPRGAGQAHAWQAYLTDAPIFRGEVGAGEA